MKNNSEGPLLRYFIQQCHNPKGFIGSAMINIWNKTFKSMTKWGLKHIDFKQTDYVLDVGCGGGETINILANKIKKGKIYGLDISAASVRASLSRNSRFVNSQHVNVIQSDVAELQFEDNYFDKVIAIQTHIYWFELEKGLMEIVRVLKHEGSFILICERDKIDYHMKQYQTNQDMANLLQRVGFGSIKVFENLNWLTFVCQKDFIS
ncbi:class I SAM-dependent methyltransferase [Bacillus atrophaeus]|uniref:class I SAM-dependent methyltransferase n=1 Tax=Bacillus atrophaeus TaxID=1452 RepID=UPI00227EDC61|nr:class I SAM-dependent methyltransferase [Bacillus atrophaeus]MCY8823364.1 class I SAM-dependent methyltransferase [Bacillus atrophaeus]MCY8841543.1 class I SAM-dependent methyltransferase [Bacillus atrophaeus]MEC0805799.1 class I SAM-dependent methyltransferase [Bacillus atrophaeus]MEC0853714.1 class I SAM-dependent methyltransferase [Bacillus atrophaeus]MEC0856841.1 class I SAM-dependent methyltransferase [Bacillus atrophaeus]